MTPTNITIDAVTILYAIEVSYDRAMPIVKVKGTFKETGKPAPEPFMAVCRGTIRDRNVFERRLAASMQEHRHGLLALFMGSDKWFVSAAKPDPRGEATNESDECPY